MPLDVDASRQWGRIIRPRFVFATYAVRFTLLVPWRDNSLSSAPFALGTCLDPVPSAHLKL